MRASRWILGVLVAGALWIPGGGPEGARRAAVERPEADGGVPLPSLLELPEEGVVQERVAGRRPGAGPAGGGVEAERAR